MATIGKGQRESITYRAFISYSHSDKAVASWLHSALERYHIPDKLVGTETSVGLVPKRLTPIFRDQDELPASGNLGAELQDALEHSLFLIVICSPASAQSKWVNEEIRQFKMIHGADKVLALVVDGVPNAKPELAGQECFAPALKLAVSPEGELSDQPCEPIAADLRKSADGKKLAKLKLISGLTGLRLDDLVQREAARRMRTLMQISVASAAAAVFAIGLALYANDRRLEANTQRAIAEQESATARAVSDFLVTTFTSANPIMENPDTITARSILDRGARRMASELEGQPEVQSRLSESIALAYVNLGLPDQAIELVDTTLANSGKESATAYSIKAEALWRKGELDAAMGAAEHGLALVEMVQQQDSAHHNEKTLADIASIQGLIHYQRGQHQLALNAFEQALDGFENMPDPDNVEIAKTLQNRSFLLSDLGELDWAASDLERAMGLARANVGESDILLGQIALAQAQVSFLSGNLEPAAEHIANALDNMQRLLDADNPTLADTFSMQGQILHAMGELDRARAALSNSVQIYTQAYGGPHYLSGIAEVYLGLIAGDKQDYQASLVHFDEAKRHYDASYGEIHANHGDLLVNRATVLASAGETERARQDCDQGMEILVATLGADAAFTRQLQAVCDEITTSQP